MEQKKEYTAPALIVHGTVEQLTQGAMAGTHNDTLNPVNTPFGFGAGQLS